MSAKHTPGPWNIYDEPRGYGFCVRTEPGGEIIADYSCFLKEVEQPARANARLIAAAPDLLEALRLCMTFIVELAESGDAGFWDAEKTPEVIAARAAIARATGEQG